MCPAERPEPWVPQSDKALEHSESFEKSAQMIVNLPPQDRPLPEGLLNTALIADAPSNETD
jgi:hypothetical protein